MRGLKAKQFNKQRYAEKAEMKKKIKQHAESLNKHKAAEAPQDKEAMPAYLLDREGMSHAKVLSNSIKQKRKEKAGKWAVPIPKVKPVGEVRGRLRRRRARRRRLWMRAPCCRLRRVPYMTPAARPAVSQDEVFKVMKSGKRQKKQWKRQVNKVTFVGESFTRKPPKFERFVRPAALRFKKAHVTHPELKATFNLDLSTLRLPPRRRPPHRPVAASAPSRPLVFLAPWRVLACRVCAQPTSSTCPRAHPWVGTRGGAAAASLAWPYCGCGAGPGAPLRPAVVLCWGGGRSGAGGR